MNLCRGLIIIVLKQISSEMISVDESISRWYGQGGGWINVGLSHYMAIGRKPEMAVRSRILVMELME